VAYVASKGLALPEVGAAVAILVEVGAGLALLVGFKARFRRGQAARALFLLFVVDSILGSKKKRATRVARNFLEEGENRSDKGEFHASTGHAD
jgi:uncharacterized membrane protein YphA (DoxX/SURF4 family)